MFDLLLSRMCPKRFILKHEAEPGAEPGLSSLPSKSSQLTGKTVLVGKNIPPPIRPHAPTSAGRQAMVLIVIPPFVWCCSPEPDRKSTRLNSSHSHITYAAFCLKKNT